jgi:hypothetical protein
MADNDQSVNLNLTATSAQARAEIALYEAQLKALRAETANLASQMVASGQTTNTVLKSALSAAATEAAQTETRLNAMKSALTETGTAAAGMHGSISTATREFRALFDELSSGRTQQTPGTLAIIANRVFGLGPAALAATGAAAGLVGVFGLLAREMERTGNAAQTTQQAFAFRGLNVSTQEIQGLITEIRNFGASADEAAKVGRALASVTDATPQLRREIVELIPTVEKALGEDAARSAERLAAMFNNLDREGRQFLEGLARTPETTKALNDFNEAIARGDRAAATRVILDQLAIAADSVKKASEEAAGPLERLGALLGANSENAINMTEAMKEADKALKQIGVDAQNNPTVQPKTAISKDEFTKQLAENRDAVNKTQTQILQDEVHLYDQRIAELKSFGLDYTAEERQRATAVAQLQRSSSQQAIEETRLMVAQINSQDKIGKEAQLQQDIAAWNQLLASHKLTADDEIQVERQKAQTIVELRRFQQEQAQGIARVDADFQVQASRIALQQRRADLEVDLALNRANADQKYQMLADLARKENELDIQAVEIERQTYTEGTVEYEKATKQIELLHLELNAKLAELNKQRAQDAARAARDDASSWRYATTEIAQAEASLTRNLLSGRMTAMQALLQLSGQLIEKEIANDLRAVTTRLLLAKNEETEKDALKQGGLLYHIFAEEAKTGATITGVETRTAAEQAGAAASNATQATNADKSVLTNAGDAASSVYAQIAKIPYVGPVLAPVAAAAAFTAVAAYRAFVSAEGGMLTVPMDGTLVEAHKDESILPAYIASPMRDFFTTGAAQGGADAGAQAKPTINVAFNLPGYLDRASFGRVMAQNKDLVMATISTAVRDGMTKR